MIEPDKALWIYFDKHERMKALYQMKEHIPDDKIYKVFADVWTNLESHYQDMKVIRRMFNYLGNNTAKFRNSMMDADEKRAYQELKKRGKWIKVYRGCWQENTEGWSWTTRRTIAELFARRHAPDGWPLIISGKVDVDDVIAYLLSRNENEIVVDPGHVEKPRRTELPYQEVKTNKLLFQAVQAGNLFGQEHEIETMVMMAQHNQKNYLEHLEERLEFFKQYGFEDKVKTYEEAKRRIVEERKHG